LKLLYNKEQGKNLPIKFEIIIDMQHHFLQLPSCAWSDGCLGSLLDLLGFSHSYYTHLVSGLVDKGAL